MPWKTAAAIRRRSPHIRRGPDSRRLHGASASPTSSRMDLSPLAGVDRTLVLLAGGVCGLEGEGEPLELRATFEPISFSGDRSLTCSLVAGPVRDFNLMVRRGTARGDVVVRREGGEAIARAGTYVCYAATGASECLVAGHPPIALAESHTLVVTSDDGSAPSGLSVNPLEAGSVALVAVIRPA